MEFNQQTIDKYSRILAFYGSFLNLKDLSDGGKELVKELTKFQIRTFVVQSLVEMEQEHIEISFNNLRDFITTEILRDKSLPDIDLRLLELIPLMQQEQLIDIELKPLPLGRQLVAARNLALLQEQDAVLRVDQ